MKFTRFYNREPKIISSAPGRLDLLNTHQDYKGLPVVGVGINLRTYVALSPSERFCEAYSETTGESVRFELNELKIKGRKFSDYLKAAVVSLIKNGYSVKCFKAIVISDVPIGSGLASSAALLVSIISGILKLSGYNTNEKEVAELAFFAENKVMKIPCGRLDQYSSAFGGFLLIRTRPPYDVERIDFDKGVFVVADTGIRHSTAEIHPVRQREINEGLRKLLNLKIPPSLSSKLSYSYNKVLWEEINEEELLPYLKKIPKKHANRILYTLRAHRSTMLVINSLKNRKLPSLKEINEIVKISPEEAKKLARDKDWDLKLLGKIMTYQHMLLRDLYEVSLPEIDAIVNAALNAGSLGAKLSGAGLGGAVVALASGHKIAKNVLASMIEAGATKGWIVKVDKGIEVLSL